MKQFISVIERDTRIPGDSRRDIIINISEVLYVTKDENGLAVIRTPDRRIHTARKFSTLEADLVMGDLL